MRVVLAHLLALLAAPIGAVIGVLLLAKLAGRLTRWHSASDGSSWMFSMPVGGFGWQVGSTAVRAISAFGAARLAFALLGVQPTLYLAVAVVLMLLVWDVRRLRFIQRPPLSPPAEAISVLRFKIGVGLVASSMAGFIFLDT
jgi:hypothetical protein